MALVMALAAIFVWFELILRAGVVYVAMMFLPLFLATMIWPATSGWVRRLVQLIVAAILSKLVIVATLSLGLSALGSGDGVSSVLAGAGMFLIAAFSPFVLFSLIPLAAEVAQPQREGRHAVAAATGTSLAWNVARTRMSFGAVGAGAAPMALGAGAMGMAGPRGGGGPLGPPGGGGGAAGPRPSGGTPAAGPGTGGGPALIARRPPRRPRPRRRPPPPPHRASGLPPSRPDPARSLRSPRLGPIRSRRWHLTPRATASGRSSRRRGRRARLGPAGLRRARARGPRGQPERRSQDRGRPGGLAVAVPGSRAPSCASGAVRRSPGRRSSGYASPPRERRHRHRSRAPAEATGSAPARTVDLPQSLAGLRILSARAARGEIGIARDGSTWTAVLAVEGTAFALLELDDKERRLARWGGGPGGFARPGSPVSRIAWIDRTVTQPVDELGRYLRDGLSLPSSHPGVRSYLELLDEAGPAARQHETFLALQIDARRASGAIRRAGGRDDGAAAVLLRELAALAEHLQRAEVVVRGALSPRLLARAIRLGFCPDDRPGLDRRGAGDPELAGTDPAHAGPMAAEESWRHYRSDGALHCTYWIAEWPRVEVGADFLLPFVLAGTTRRTIAVVMEPLDPQRALRAAENARTNEISDDELRARLGLSCDRPPPAPAAGTGGAREGARRGPLRRALLGVRHRLHRLRGRSSGAMADIEQSAPEGAPRASGAPGRAGDGLHLHAPALPGPSVRARPRQPAHQADERPPAGRLPVHGRGGPRRARRLHRPRLYTRASFCFDPWVLYEHGVITGPSALVAGQVGKGKSALVKTYLARQALFGRRAVVIDPKGEYGPLAEWFGGAPIRLAPGGEVRLNPLDAAGGREERVALLGALVAGSLRRALEPEEHTALDLAYRAAALTGTPTLPAVQHHLLHPAAEAAATIAVDAQDLATFGRGCALELRRLCEGDLHGMFDGPTSTGSSSMRRSWCSTSRPSTARRRWGC